MQHSSRPRIPCRALLPGHLQQSADRQSHLPHQRLARCPKRLCPARCRKNAEKAQGDPRTAAYANPRKRTSGDSSTP